MHVQRRRLMRHQAATDSGSIIAASRFLGRAIRLEEGFWRKVFFILNLSNDQCSVATGSVQLGAPGIQVLNRQWLSFCQVEACTVAS
jgi:hypothetical protein